MLLGTEEGVELLDFTLLARERLVLTPVRFFQPSLGLEIGYGVV